MASPNQHCLLDGHQNSQILGACLNDLCKSKRSYCHHCISLNHSQHVTDLKNFEQLNNYTSQLAQVNLDIQDKSQSIQSALSMLTSQLRDLYVDPQTNFSDLNQTDLEKHVQKLMSVQQIQNSSLLTNLNEIVQKFNFGKKEGDSQIKNLQSSCLSPVQSNIQQFLKNISSNSIIINPTNQTTFKFSNELVFKGIQIQDNQKTAICTGLEWGFIMCEPIIPKTGISRFSFQVFHKNICNLYIGVCHKDKIIQSNYSPNSFQNLGHGAYLLFSTGLILSHLQGDINYQFKGFSYSNNDIIIMDVDMIQQQIIFTHQQKQQQIVLKLDVTQDLYPYAELCAGSSIQILQN